jgi:hypothetical protein
VNSVNNEKKEMESATVEPIQEQQPQQESPKKQDKPKSKSKDPKQVNKIKKNKIHSSLSERKEK